MIGHGMMVEQIGNLLDASQNLDFENADHSDAKFPRPDNLDNM